MIKLSIVNEVNGRSFGSTWESVSEKNAYLDKQIAKQGWGKNERHMSESEMTKILRPRIISTEVTPEVIAVEYVAPVEAVEGISASEGIEEVIAIEAVAEVLEIEGLPEIIIHLVKADYVITEEDLSLDVAYRNEQKIESRKKEYKSIEHVMHIILDHGVDSQEFKDYQTERATIKVKYPKE